MALKQIMLAKKIEGKEREIENLRNLTKQFEIHPISTPENDLAAILA